MNARLPSATASAERPGQPSMESAARARPRPAVPPLLAGDRLTHAEFERRYLAHPEIKKAELIEGIVYLPTPTHFEKYGRPHNDIAGWLSVYRAVTPGVLACTDVTIRLDYDNEVQPDALLRLDAALGGRSHITADDYLAGPPELIVEIAASSSAYDLHDKRRVYQRSGVQEYLALQVYEEEATWWVLREGVLRAAGSRRGRHPAQRGLSRPVAERAGVLGQRSGRRAGDRADRAGVAGTCCLRGETAGPKGRRVAAGYLVIQIGAVLACDATALL